MAQSLLEKRFTPKAQPQPEEPTPAPTVHSALASIVAARSAIGDAQEQWPEFCDYSDHKAQRLAELAAQEEQIEANRRVIASLRHEIDDTRLEAERVREQAKADVAVAQNDLARWRAAAERSGRW